jgi:CubicO group peptidase (beta-lactamase class C family)
VTPTAHTTELQRELAELARAHDVPGVTVAVLEGDEVTKAATGVLSKHTGVAVTTDTLFQIASVTKPFTATLVMQLVDDGSCDLDASVRSYLPELAFQDAEATDAITVRQLLCHTSGVDGDHFEDTGRGDDCLERYVASCGALPQISAPGTVFTYCNAGYGTAGRLVERLTGQTWDAALKERILDPLGMQHTVTLPEEALLHRVAVGHDDQSQSGESAPVTTWGFPRASGPTGGIAATAADVIAFARMHLDAGRAGDGSQVLSADSVRAMQEPQAEIPEPWRFASAYGLGWAINEWDGRRVIGHDGGGIGQTAWLRILPEERFAIAALANGFTGPKLFHELFKRLFRERVGVELPDLPAAADDVEFDPSRYVGTYERRSFSRTTVEAHDGGLVVSIDWLGAMASLGPVVRQPMRPIDATSFLVRVPGFEEDWPLVFFDFDDGGRPRYFHFSGRANPRID